MRIIWHENAHPYLKGNTLFLDHLALCAAKNPDFFFKKSPKFFILSLFSSLSSVHQSKFSGYFLICRAFQMYLYPDMLRKGTLTNRPGIKSIDRDEKNSFAFCNKKCDHQQNIIENLFKI
jgi:hypothetical protein